MLRDTMPSLPSTVPILNDEAYRLFICLFYFCEAYVL